MKMERQSSETSEYKMQTPENHPKERIQHSEHGESLKSRIQNLNLQFHFKIDGSKTQSQLTFLKKTHMPSHWLGLQHTLIDCYF